MALAFDYVKQHFDFSGTQAPETVLTIVVSARDLIRGLGFFASVQLKLEAFG